MPKGGHANLFYQNIGKLEDEQTFEFQLNKCKYFFWHASILAFTNFDSQLIKPQFLSLYSRAAVLVFVFLS